MGTIETEIQIDASGEHTSSSVNQLGGAIYSADGENYRARLREIGIDPDKPGEPLSTVDFKLYRKVLQKHANFSRREAKAQERRVRGEYIDSDEGKKVAIVLSLRSLLSHFKRLDRETGLEPVPIEDSSR